MRSKPDRPQLEKIQEQLLNQIHNGEARIRDLERELAVLKKTRPAPALLQDLERASIAELLDMAGAVRRVGQERLLAVPEEVSPRYATPLGRKESGAARLLPRGKHVTLVEKRGGGANYSFATRENDYNKEPDIELQRGYYATSFYGGTFGFLVDLGVQGR